MAFCSNTTKIQRQYEENRDECRQLAELKLNAMQESGGDTSAAAMQKSNKTRLVGMFSECMNNKAWAVPSPDDKKKADAQPTPPSPSPEIDALEAAAPARVIDTARQRTADCAFARQAADSSIIAKKRAEACDLECANAARHAPEAPKSPACP